MSFIIFKIKFIEKELLQSQQRISSAFETARIDGRQNVFMCG